MTEPEFDTGVTGRRLRIFLVILVLVAVIIWFVAPFGTTKQEAPVQPVTQSKDWAPEPTGPAVPVNLPKTPMTNVPDKAP